MSNNYLSKKAFQICLEKIANDPIAEAKATAHYHAQQMAKTMIKNHINSRIDSVKSLGRKVKALGGQPDHQIHKYEPPHTVKNQALRANKIGKNMTNFKYLKKKTLTGSLAGTAAGLVVPKKGRKAVSSIVNTSLNASDLWDKANH